VLRSASHRRAASAALALLAALPAVAAAQPARFTVREIPTFGGASSFALDVNNPGTATGNAQTPLGTLAPRLNAFRWDGTTLTNLGTLPGSNNFSRGYAINDAGVIVGESDNNAPRAFRWENGTMTDLGTLGGTSAVAHGINNRGQIVGIASNGTVSRAFLWENGAMRDLGAADGSTDTFARAWAIDDAGVAVGFSRSAAGVSQATRWAGGTAESLGSLGTGTLFSEALGVSDAGMIVGRSNTGAATRFGTSIFQAFLWQNGAMSGLDPLGYTFSVANDVNRAGWAVGHGTNVSGLPQGALLWQGGAAYDLNAQLVRGGGWTLRSAEGVNERGQIVGYGTFNGQTRGFVLTPVPEPATVSLMAAGLVLAAAVGSRRARRTH